MRCVMRGKLSDLLAALAVIMMLGIASPVMADQNDPQLDELFDALKRTTTDREIKQLTRNIWDRWTAFENDSDTYKTMVQGMTLMNQGQLSHAELVFSAIIDGLSLIHI